MNDYTTLIESMRNMEVMVCGAAADAIEALQARVSELTAALSAPDPIPCETCGGTGEIDESIGGEHFSNKHATCPDCDGSGVIESIHDFRAGQWWVKALDEIWGSPSPDVTPDQKRAVAVVHNLLRHVANLGRITVTTDESGRAVAVTRQDDEHRILSVIWEAPVTAPVRLTDEQIIDATSETVSYFAPHSRVCIARSIETAVLRANGFKTDHPEHPLELVGVEIKEKQQ